MSSTVYEGNAVRSSRVMFKDPDAIVPIVFKWERWLAETNDVLTMADFDAGGLTIVSSSFTTITAQVRVSGGIVGRSYLVRCRITTGTGDMDDRTQIVRVLNR